MPITQFQKINQGDIQSVIDAINSEITRRGLTTVSIPASGDKIDDTLLDTLASKIVEIRGSHCYCQTNSSMVHSGCPAYVNPSLQSSQVDEGVKIVASEASLPDVLDIQTDLAKLTVTAACPKTCNCNNDCRCHGVSNLAVVCPSQCNCNTYCRCQSKCNCETACSCDGACSCESYSTCSCDRVCSCVSYSPCSCASYCGCNSYDWG